MGTPLQDVKGDQYYVWVGRTIKAYRVREGITQSHLGKELDIPLSMIREYEQGLCLPGADRLIKIMVRLGIPPIELLNPAAVASLVSIPQRHLCVDGRA